MERIAEDIAEGIVLLPIVFFILAVAYGHVREAFGPDDRPGGRIFPPM